jgi:hypothetical protein
MITYEAADGTLVMADVEFTTRADEAAMIATASPRAVLGLRREFAAARAAERAMSERATDEQRSIGYGDCVTREWDGLTIYGVIQPRGLVARDELDHGAGLGDTARVLARLDDGYRRGWRYGRWHSVDSPEGEYGAAHVADLRKISVSEFDAAQWRGWKP